MTASMIRHLVLTDAVRFCQRTPGTGMRRAAWPEPGQQTDCAMVRIEPNQGKVWQFKGGFPRAGWRFGWQPTVEDLAAADWEVWAL